MNRVKTKQLVTMGMLAAIAYVVMLVGRIPVVLFLKYDPKDVVIAIGGFLLGPMASFVVSLMVSLLEMVSISETGPIGALMNLLSTCSFACVASLIYKRRHTLRGAVEGLLAGAVVMVGTMLLWNWLITPLYMTGTSRSDVAAMLVPVFLPFNLLKAGLNSAFILLLYKPLVTALRKAHLVDAPKNPVAKKKTPWGIYLMALFLLATCILLVLVFQGKL